MMLPVRPSARDERVQNAVGGAQALRTPELPMRGYMAVLHKTATVRPALSRSVIMAVLHKMATVHICVQNSSDADKGFQFYRYS